MFCTIPQRYELETTVQYGVYASRPVQPSPCGNNKHSRVVLRSENHHMATVDSESNMATATHGPTPQGERHTMHN